MSERTIAVLHRGQRGEGLNTSGRVPAYVRRKRQPLRSKRESQADYARVGSYHTVMHVLFVRQLAPPRQAPRDCLAYFGM